MIKNTLVPTQLTTKDFYYDLPPERIAQHPLEDRASSRMLVMDKASGEITHTAFRELHTYLKAGDVLVINDSRVIPARLYGKTEDGKDVEILLLRQHAVSEWEVLVRPGKRAKIGRKLSFGEGRLHAEVTQIVEEGNRMLTFSCAEGENLLSVMDEIGTMPLPPYITEKLSDRERYQTVYAREKGSAAAPTAGLHFTKEVLASLKEQGILIAPVMLHVGLGTFRPVKEDKITDHVMHSEFFSVSEESAAVINEAKKNGGRVLAVGTTSCRVLESASDEEGIVHPMTADTGIFIYPGYRFKTVDMLLTNFHLPESTLLMLVSALSDKEKVMEAYRQAIAREYRFYSFGDCMLLT